MKLSLASISPLGNALLFTTVLIGAVAPQAHCAPANIPVGTAKTAPNAPQLVPRPASMKLLPGKSFALTDKTVLLASSDIAQQEAKMLSAELAPALGFALPVAAKTKSKSVIAFQLDTKANTGDEGYSLEANQNRVTITAAKPAGLFYGAQTLRQLLPVEAFATTPQPGINWQIPAVSIQDAPRFVWRGLMLDCGRHFFSVAEVKEFLDAMAIHKLNTFHWHLTEDQGWRLEIKKYPRLTEFGSQRTESPRKGNAGQGDGTPYGGFYTQAQAREVVAYAAARHITVVPEIEIPGHAAAAIASYPQLGNTDVPNYAPTVITRWGVHPYTLAPKEETFTFIEEVLREVMDIFPSKIIHIGGDEAPTRQWEASPFARDFMEKNNLKNGHELQSYFTNRIEKFLNANGRNLIGWDEILEGGLAPNAAVMSWRGEAGAVSATKQGHPVVMASNGAYYLDYAQSKAPTEPETIGGFIPLKRVYNFDPGASVGADKISLLLGAQGQIWTEYIADFPKVEYMAFPRACALAETDWSPAAAKDYADFYQRLQTHVRRLQNQKINFRPLDVELTPAGSWKTGEVGETWIQRDWDITPQISKSGNWNVLFQYSNGGERLDIARIDLLENGQSIGFDEHEGRTGSQDVNNTYRVTLPQFTPGAKYTLRAKVRADGGTDSNGDIYVSPI